VESPDLSAYIAVQCDALARIASDLGRGNESAHWAGETERMQRLMMWHFWDEEKFSPVRSGTHARCQGDSLLGAVPLILGNRLDKRIQRTIVAALSDRKRFLAPFGLASESMDSPYHASDCCWRGPVWASPSWLIITGLIDIGESALARDIAARFMNACGTGGMARNFDPQTGRGRDDLHYGSTAAVYLLCARMLSNHSA